MYHSFSKKAALFSCDTEVCKLPSQEKNSIFKYIQIENVFSFFVILFNNISFWIK